MTVTLGVDPHKASHTVVATDPVGRQLGQATSRGTRTSDHQVDFPLEGLCWRIREWSGLMVCCGALVCRDAHPDSTGDER